jgi:hypothetical protein
MRSEFGKSEHHFNTVIEKNIKDKTLSLEKTESQYQLEKSKKFNLKMMKQVISWDQLVILLDNSGIPESECEQRPKEYLGWQSLSPDFERELQPFANIRETNVSKLNNEFPSEKGYWSPESPIAAKYYPYNGCQVFRYLSCFFLVYIEFGGHVPEKRCRLLQRKLIIL